MYGFGYVWLSQDIGDISMFIAQFKFRLIDCCSQKWHSDITGSTRCDTYKEFKSLLNAVIFFAIKPTPVLGVIPNGKKYLFFPNAWFKIPNLRKFPNQADNCNHNSYMYC